MEASIEADRKKVEAEGYQKKIETEANEEANALLIKAKAEAEAIRLKKLAEAEGELKLAEVKAANIAAETENIANLKRAGLADGAIVQWAIKDQLVGVAQAQTQMFEHLNLGQVTVVGGSEQAGSFLMDLVSKVSQASALKDMIPGATGLIGKLEKFDQDNKPEKFEDVK